MKRVLLLLSSLATTLAFAQLPVSQTAENRNVVLEEFTGIYCVFCPDGHKRANQLKANNPGDVVLVNIHTGSFANPSGGDPDYRTTFGSALANQSGLTGYPAGTVNRQLFSGLSQGSGTAMSRGDWAGAAATVLADPSYVNVAMDGVVDVTNRTMTIDVEVYYTGVAPSFNMLNIVLMQNNILGPQTGGTTFYPQMVTPEGEYRHMHMLRDMITGQWGDSITNTAQGQVISLQYNYNIPTDVNGVPVELADLEIAAFLTEGNQYIVTGQYGAISYTNFANSVDLGMNSVTVPQEICGGSFEPTVNVKNFGSDTITSFDVVYDVGGAAQTYSWSGTLLPLGNVDVNLPMISFSGNQATLNASVSNISSGVDQNTSNDVIASNTIANTDVATSGNSTLIVTQDAYGSEITWEFMDENGTVIASGGPYSDLSSSGTLAHQHPVNYQNTGCYYFAIYDSYGDGINSGYGNGSVELVDGNNDRVFYSNGTYNSEFTKPYELTSLVGVEENNGFEANVYPNPANEEVSIDLSLTQSSDVTVRVINSLGAVVYMNAERMDMGSNMHRVDLSSLESGIYHVNITVNNHTVSERLSVIR